MLTTSAVTHAKPQKKPYKLYDERSMFLLVTPSGGKLWRWKYRRPITKKENMLALGSFPDISLKQAREKREEARALLADGIDPGEQRKVQTNELKKINAAAIAMDTFEEVDADIAMLLRSQTNASRPLAALGVSEMEEHVYRALLKHRLATAKDIADTLSLPPKQVQRLLDRLINKGLSTATLERTPRYTAPPPELAIKALAGRRLADIERARSDIERVSLVIPELKDHAGHSEAHEHEQVVELITDQDILRQTVIHMQQTAESELMGFQVAPVLFPMVYKSYLKKNVRACCISDRSYTDLPGGLETIRMAVQAGENARICSSLPVKMLIVDRRMGLMPLNSGDPSGQTLLIRPCALLDALCALFEFYWERATPISITAAGDLVTGDAAHGLSEGAQNLIPLLAAGLNDKASALEAGMSEATLARRIAELMKHYDTRTRFQLGWRTALEAYPDGLPKAR